MIRRPSATGFPAVLSSGSRFLVGTGSGKSAAYAAQAVAAMTARTAGGAHRHRTAGKLLQTPLC
jgi:hypothetical protein